MCISSNKNVLPQLQCRNKNTKVIIDSSGNDIDIFRFYHIDQYVAGNI